MTKAIKLTVKTILIVEDDDDIGLFLKEFILSETGYEAAHVTSGNAALKAVVTTRPILFIIDYYLVGGMNGIELYDQLQGIAESRGIPVILMSANLPVREMQKRNIVGIHKPFELDELLQSIEQVLAA